MKDASQAWESAADIDFIHVAELAAECERGNEAVVFDVRPVNTGGRFLASSFRPATPRESRSITIDSSAFELSEDGKLTLTGILRHEIGDILGFRHEHTRPDAGSCFEDNNWRAVGPYNPASVMHYPQCGGTGDWSLTLQESDKNGAACIYGPAPGRAFDPAICL